MATLDILMFVFLGLVIVGGIAGFLIYNKE